MKARQDILLTPHELNELEKYRQQIINAFIDRDDPTNFYSNVRCLLAICDARQKYNFMIRHHEYRIDNVNYNTACCFGLFTNKSKNDRKIFNEKLIIKTINEHYDSTFSLQEVKDQLDKEPRIKEFRIENGTRSKLIFLDESDLDLTAIIGYERHPHAKQPLILTKDKKRIFCKKMETLALRKDNLLPITDETSSLSASLRLS